MSSIVAPKGLPEFRAASPGIPRLILTACRPRQWSKNLFVFAGIIFAAQIADPRRWADAIIAFTAYCAASSACYLINDVMDAPADRLHPTKHRRPIASRELSPELVTLTAAVLVMFALALTAALGVTSFELLLAFLALQIAYTFRLKRFALIDILAIAGIFVIRATAGGVAVDVSISPWLLLCTGLLALFLALAKRRAELVLVTNDATPGRTALHDYSLSLVDQLVTIVASSAVLSYSLYTFTASDSKTMMVTIPFVLFGIFRYLLLIHRDGSGEEPENVLLSDRQIQATVLLWTIAAAVILFIAG